MESYESKSPVLFLVFNRPDVTARVFEAIRRAKPSRLYVACDGPRDERVGEGVKVATVREIVTQIDWDCELKTLFREGNLGCRKAVSEAITWFFGNEELGIILEDDCLPVESFFPYMDEALTKYADDSSIGCVTGYIASNSLVSDNSCILSRYNHCWGWGSWRDSWLNYNDQIENWPVLRESDWLLSVGQGDHTFASYWTRIFDRLYEGEFDSWAYRWTFACWKEGTLTVLPGNNMIENLGFNSDATHTKRCSFHYPQTIDTEIIVDFGAAKFASFHRDKWIGKNHFGHTWFRQTIKYPLIRSAKKIVNRLFKKRRI